MNPLYLIILAIIGFSVSFYLYYSKTHHKKLHCITGHSCDYVMHSKYGKTFGIENTLMGLFYYALIFLYAVLLILNRNLFKYDIVYYFIVSASVGSVIFSLYLTDVQAFVLKKWCDYCIISSIASVLILIALI